MSIPESEVPDLKKFSLELQQRIAQAEEGAPLYFRIEDIQLLIGGLSMSQLHIFQGISGTGKTSLAKAFAKAMGGHCTDIAVQAGWRDRDDLLGHYNAFEKRFYERDCLQGLYTAQTSAYRNRCNIILLDEMNLSRPEQYFAEFLSALEKNDPRERLISLSESQLPNAPALLVEGRKIRVPHNVWFVGTANHDETTSEFADKTYGIGGIDTSSQLSISPLDLYVVERMGRTLDEWLLRKPIERYGLKLGPLPSAVKRLTDGWPEQFEGVTATHVRLVAPLNERQSAELTATLRESANVQVSKLVEAAVEDVDVLSRQCGHQARLIASPPADFYCQCETCQSTWSLKTSGGKRRLTARPKGGGGVRPGDGFTWAGRDWLDVELR